MFIRVAGATLVAMVAAVAPGSARGQTAAAPAPPASAATAQPAPSPPAPMAGWNDGFFLQTPDGVHQLLFGVTLQTDGRFSLDDPPPITNTFILRKARPTFAGRVTRYFEFRLMPELAGTATVLDAYFDIRFSPTFRLRSGKDKTPIGYEVLISDGSLIFPERSVVSLLLPSRDVGFQAQGELAGGRIRYGGGVFNGNPTDGASSVTDVDVNNGKDVAGRIVFLPFRNTKGSRLTNLGFHFGGSTGTQSGGLPAFRTSIGQVLFSYLSGTIADGRRTRVTPAVFLYSGRLGAFAEYARSTAEVARAGTPATIANQAWNVTASYVLTGEATSDRGVRPRAPFDPAAGHWGALQVSARFAKLHVDPDAFAGGLAADGAIQKARQLSLGTTWFLNALVKVYATYERFTFDGGRDAENSILFRTQLAF
jgi:phosphate-selective porin OprO/OprP